MSSSGISVSNSPVADLKAQPDDPQIRSRERVRDLAEVFTASREVTAMLDLVPGAFETIDTTFLEPSCGNGNFLVEILRRKLALIDQATFGGTTHWFEVAALRALMAIYGVDINEDNVRESRRRLRAALLDEFEERGRHTSKAFRAAVKVVVDANLRCGDALNGAEEILFLEWVPEGEERFGGRPFYLAEPELSLFDSPPPPMPAVHFFELPESVK